MLHDLPLATTIRALPSRSAMSTSEAKKLLPQKNKNFLSAWNKNILNHKGCTGCTYTCIPLYSLRSLKHHATVYNLKTDDGIMLKCRRRKTRRRSTEDECGPNWSLMKAAFTKAENPQRTKQRFRSPVLTYQGDAICMAIQNCRRFRCQSALVDCPPPCLTALTLLAL